MNEFEDLLLDLSNDSFMNTNKKEKVKAISQKAVEDKALKRYLKNEELHYHKYENLKQLCPLPLPNEEYVIITEKQFNAFALIQHLCDRNVIDEMYLAIYRINEPTVDKLINMMNADRIKSAKFVISSFFNQTKPNQTKPNDRRHGLKS